MAILANVVARVAGSKTSKPADFMPDFDKAPVEQTPKQQAALFALFAHAHNESLKRRG